MRPWISLIRINQWYKNLLCLVMLLAVQPGYQLGSSAFDLIAIVAAFCLASSAVYVFNDLMDRQKDARTADRQHRPLASGEIKPIEAILLIPALIMSSLALAPDLSVAAWIGLYWLVNLVYNLFIKRHYGYGMASALTITICYSVRMMPVLWLDGVATSTGILLMILVAMVAFSLVVWKQRSLLFFRYGVRRALRAKGVMALSLIAFLMVPFWGILSLVLYPLAVYSFLTIYNTKGTREPLKALWGSSVGVLR